MNNQDNNHRVLVETKNVRRVKNAVRSAVTGNRILAVVADVGSGKTELFNHLAEFWLVHPNRFRVVTMKGWEMRASRISSIMRMLIETINPDAYVPQPIERLYKALEVELRTFCRKPDNHVILMVDEAQELSIQTLRDIKKIYEISGHGRDHLLSVVLFGKTHRKWTKVMESPELGFRMYFEFLDALGGDELIQIAEQRFGIKFSSKKVQDRFVSNLQFKSPLGLEFFSKIVRKSYDYDDGAEVLITEEMFIDISMIMIKQLMSMHKISTDEMAQFANKVIPGRSINRQRISEWRSGKLNDEKLSKDFHQVLQQLIVNRENDAIKRLAGE